MIEVKVRMKNTIGYAPNTESWHFWHIPEIMYSSTERSSRKDWISIPVASQVAQRPSEIASLRETPKTTERRASISGCFSFAFIPLF